MIVTAYKLATSTDNNMWLNHHHHVPAILISGDSHNLPFHITPVSDQVCVLIWNMSCGNVIQVTISLSSLYCCSIIWMKPSDKVGMRMESCDEGA